MKMSHHSDDHLIQAGSDSFWEPGNYKRTTKRIEDGYKLCSELQTLVHERAEIEKAYAKSLRGWSKKWGELIEKGPEYGTTEAGWKGMLTESDRLSDVHLKIKENLCNDVISQIKTWQKDNYHKNMMHIKERKEMEDAFKKAQKPWAKILAKVEKCKADYHSACKTEKTAANQERNANSDSSMSQDQEDVQKCREKYEQALQEINKYNPIYVEDMKSVFIKCQEMEETRLRFFKEVLFSVHKCLNISQEPSLPQIYEEFYHIINNADSQKDLKWWSNNHGVNMPMTWPEFVDYPPPAAPTTNNKPTSLSIKSTTTSNGRNSSQESPRTQEHAAPATPQHKSPQNSVQSTASTPNRASQITNGTNSKSDQNPFEEEEWDEGDGAENVLVDNGEPGVPVKALYDYEGAESDELSFKQGEIFEKLEDEDEQGWCKGRKNGRVGLYPANYVEVIP
uniref:CSON009988 protein n=1 Tax=Culicoides sonorensis TaxID=179676 RepID=A0A336LKI0_CULSO